MPHAFIINEETRSVAECIECIIHYGGRKTPSVSGDDLEILASAASILDNPVPMCLRFPVWTPPAQPDSAVPKDSSYDVWRLGTNAATRGNPLHYFWISLKNRNSRRLSHYQEVAITEFGPFRALGMAIWDLWRLYSLGLKSASAPGTGMITNPYGQEIPQGASPPAWGSEDEYRWSLLIRQWQKKEDIARS